MDGFLNLNKPLGLTSHDCVARVRRILKLKRVGHAGTLDPAASGVLPIAIGRATRLLQYLNSDKVYRATVCFGMTTSTDDLEGEILSQAPASQLTLAAIEQVLPQFLGRIQQIPPAYSAIQVQGQRLYQLARSGVAVEVPSREVEIYHIQVLDWQAGDYPKLALEINCGSGTYIRAIARDLGKVLQVGATLSQLQRTVSSGFAIPDAIDLVQLEQLVQQQQLTFPPADQPLQHLPAIDLPEALATRWRQGQRLAWSNFVAQPLRVYSQQQFLGITEVILVAGQPVLQPSMVYEPMVT
ncbi:MAG: tRNA pseudouridine(55) synthase TruB [Synechococcales bacterium]|nr:tRNA pseudouridine(55) synthase TruB [Synechococcales bacterium]